jgi:hypothetical protein
MGPEWANGKLAALKMVSEKARVNKTNNVFFIFLSPFQS